MCDWTKIKTGQKVIDVSHMSISGQLMDSEIVWDILKFPNLSRVQPALPDSSQVKPLSPVKPY